MDEIVKKDEQGLATFDAELAQYAKEAAASENQAGKNFLKFRGGLFANKTPMKDNQANLVVLDAINVNEFYEGAYDADKLESPSCYAIGRDEATMSPHPDAKSVPKMPDGSACTSCAKCPKNQWGSGNKEKGKACKNTRRIACIAASAHPEDEELYFAKMSVSQLKGWGAYVKSLAGQYQIPPFAVVTRLKWNPDPVSQYRLGFSFVERLPKEGMEVIMRRVREARESIGFAFPDFKQAEEGEAPAEQPKTKKKY